ncbi:APG9-domain-containing protein [Guyanagaster necrorhizus]|uniref:Autophagy-related protein 9 n=1 Tax=Guyanagaster necrorhizus TaxID=856835 RepID=A0A9P7VVF9_9AGAR|nr:APG9-domain-containing protein [Guyanagaster necrorhizus MCA 3950]KAG7448093.1 APG9-domain-containing protein [Guyanagaster necrorhizus MCA 3950]
MMSSSTSPRRNPSSRSYQGSLYQSASSSRPFLNMLNPMSRPYQGYTQASQSLLEEEEEERRSSNEEEEEDVETGHSQSTIFQRDAIPLSKSRSKSKSHGKPRVSWDAAASSTDPSLHPNIHQEDKIHDQDSDDGEVPQSFMIEATSRRPSKRGKGKETTGSSFVGGRQQPLFSIPGRKLPPVLPIHASVSIPPRPSELDTEDAEATPRPDDISQHSPRQHRPMRGLDAYERALWNWVNVYNLDAFLQDVYFYYEGKGIYSIALSRGLNLLTVGFVIGFSTFLLGCIDYSRIHPDKTMRLSNAIVDHCVSNFSGFTLLFFILFTAFYIWQIALFILGTMRLVDMYNFYTHLLKIPDVDIPTISWPEVVRRISAIREENPLTAISSKSARNTNDTTTAKLDAHDIANRIMRQENYLIALFNKELLDLRVPWPLFLKQYIAEDRGKGKMLTQALEWNLRFCLMEYLFDKHGRVRKVFLKSKNRTVLIEGLKRRFIFMGILNAIFAPFIVLYLLMYSFFRYFEEYHKDPSSIGGRRYTSFAQWKFREFNELPHFFIRRLDESCPAASMYIGQFPNEKMTLIMRFVAFISGSFAAVLFLATVLDPDIFVHLEITSHRTVLFYLTVFGSILAVARGMIPEDNRVFDPELLMTEVITYTHYMPDEWKGQLHSKRIHQEFGELYAMKVMIFVQEVLSVVLTPFVLWFSLPSCAPAIVDFFHEFTVHVDGRGYVCSFAEFNFERHGNVKFGAPAQNIDKRMISNEGKMEKSFLNFKAANPDWNPTDPSGSLYLSRMADFTAAHLPGRRRPGTGVMPLDHSNGSGERKTEVDRAQEYDRALRQSQLAARRRGGSMLGASMLGPPGPSGSSIFGGMSTAQTVVLGDSQGSVPVETVRKEVSKITDSDLAEDGGVGSGLGESYVDGAKRTRTFGEAEEEEEGFEDGGVLGLLAQIYDRRDGPTRVL